MDDQIFGRSIGDYELLARINRGSISELYKARWKSTGEIVAVRKLLSHLVSDSEARATFARGARIEITLDHPNIVKVHSIETSGPEPYIIIEFVEGDNLKQSILKRELTSTAQQIKVLHELADALNYIHARGIIHHDIKPENILIPQNGDAKLTDFSLAVQKKKDYISSKRISGSPSYVAPEIIRYRKYDERIDIYSLGITAYELLTGVLPYSGSTQRETRMMHISRSAKPIQISKVNPQVPPKLEKAVEKAMEKARRKRYPHISLFLRDIREVARTQNLQI